MKTCRTDVKISKQSIYVPNSILLGYSTNKLYAGDMFKYKETYLDGTYTYRIAVCHGRIKPLFKIEATDKIQWYVLAQTVSENMQFTYERWIDPLLVVETIPSNKVNPHLKAFFAEQEKNQ